MSIPTQSYESVYVQYSAALNWMNTLGIKLAPGRTSYYEKVLARWKTTHKTAVPEEGEEIFPDFVSAIFEILDFVSVHKAFTGVDPIELSSIVEKLKKGVNGPFNGVDETPDSTAARNFLFEASVAAKAHQPTHGVEAILDVKSDTGIRLGDKKIWVECKRVTSLESLENNVRKVSSQLERVFAREIGAGHRGIVAIDVSKILNRGDKIYVARNDVELMSSVDRMIDQFIAEHSHIWEDVYRRRHRKLIGTMIRFAFMATSDARNLLVRVSQWAVNPRLSISQSDELLQRRLVSVLREAE